MLHHVIYDANRSLASSESDSFHFLLPTLHSSSVHHREHTTNTQQCHSNPSSPRTSPLSPSPLTPNHSLSLPCVFARPTSLSSLKKAGLIGSSIIPSSFSPSVLVSAQYTKAGSVELGNTLSIKETQEEPAVSFTSVRSFLTRVTEGEKDGKADLKRGNNTGRFTFPNLYSSSSRPW